MTPDDSRSPLAVVTWLAAGIVLGGLVTAGIVVAVTGLVRGDAPVEANGPPTFTDSHVSGVEHSYEGGFEFFVGGGLAVFDCNADLYPDLYMAGGGEVAGLYVNQSEGSEGLNFAIAPGGTTDLTGVTGAYPIDIDSDGITDLAVLRLGDNVMLRGLGDCEFERANQQWGVDGGDDWTAAFSATWENGESLPTLAFGNYLALDALDSRDRCESHYLFRPEATTYAEPTLLSPGRCTLSILFSDWDRSGRRDLRMTNDRHYYTDGEEQLWRMEAGRVPELYTRADGWQRMQIWGMGIASHDLTGDGVPEVFLTSQGDNKLQALSSDEGGPHYEDIALSVGATAHRPFLGDTNRPSTAWHAEFGDVNNDGFPDLFVSKGNVDSQVEFAMDDPNNLLLGGPDGTFEESAAEAGILDYSRSRGATLTDLDLDGLLDLVVVERRDEVKIWHNTGSDDTGNWLAVDLTQSAPNVDGIGSWVEVRIGTTTLRSEVTIGGGHASGELGPVHFGLGSARSVQVRALWPDGQQGPWHTVEANRVVEIDRDSATASPLFPLQDSTDR